MKDCRIYKYQFTVRDEIVIKMPERAEIVDVEIQNGVPCIWALVNSKATVENRHFHIFGTGHPIPDGMKHIATFQDPPFVWHLFEQR